MGNESMKKSAIIYFVALLLLPVAPAFAVSPPQTFTVDGNIYIVTAGSTNKLTDSGLDFDPVLSADGKLVAFARRTPGFLIDGPIDAEEANEIWIIGIDGKGARRIVKGRESDSMEKVLTGLCNPVFSPDGQTVYFTSSAWATSDAIHRSGLKDAKTSFVTDGSLLGVIMDGDYKGHLIVNQHRYFVLGGSYDWYWLIDPNGRTIGPVGENEPDIPMLKPNNSQIIIEKESAND